MIPYIPPLLTTLLEFLWRISTAVVTFTPAVLTNVCTQVHVPGYSLCPH